MSGLTIEREVHFQRGRRSRKGIEDGPPPEASTTPAGTIPRISRLMALALRFDRLIKAGEITDQADLARLGHVTRARVTQIMNLLQLAPDIQEAILFLPRTVKGRDPIREIMVRPIAAEPDWRNQRRLWKCLTFDQGMEPMVGDDGAPGQVSPGLTRSGT
jgi:hypothetical protein